MASTSDPLGVISPCQVLGKVIYSKPCDRLRSVALNKESIMAVDLHFLGNVSIVVS